jgi:LEA14-like dessication related protein
MRNLLLFFSFSFFISCKIYKPVEFKGIEDYSFSSQTGCNPICLTLELYNPNPYNVSFKSAIIKANLDNDDLGYLKLTKPSILKKKNVSLLELSIGSDVKKIQPMLSGFLNYFVGKDIALSIDGLIKVKALGLAKELKVKKTFILKK